jgi:hypothetical protein
MSKSRQSSFSVGPGVGRDDRPTGWASCASNVEILTPAINSPSISSQAGLPCGHMAVC